LPDFLLDPAKLAAAEQQVAAKLAPQGAGPLDWMSVIGAEAAPAAVDASLPPFMTSGPLETKAAAVVQEKTEGGPLNWMDVIGAGTEDEKK
jgi:hypothetical protein